MDIATINIIIVRGENNVRKKARKEITNAETRFMCIPGKRPVNVPEITPSSNAMVISRIILSLPKV